MSQTTFEPRIVGFLCNWCSYAGANLAGTSRIQYAPTSASSACLVAVGWTRCCRQSIPGRGRWRDGVWAAIRRLPLPRRNYFARRRFQLMHGFLDFVGIDRRRIKMDWCPLPRASVLPRW